MRGLVTRVLPLMLVVGLMCIAVGASQPLSTRPATEPATTRPSPAALQAVKELLNFKQLRLATEDISAADTFSLRLTLFQKRDGKWHVMKMAVARSKDRMGVLVSNEAGLPRGYFTNQLLIWLDNDEPGTMLVHEGGSALARFELIDNSAILKCGYGIEKGPSRVVVDLGSVLKDFSDRAVAGNYTAEQRQLKLTAADSGLLVYKAEHRDDQIFPIRALVFSTRDTAIIVDEIKLGVASGLLGQNLDDFRKLGMPTRKLTDREASELGDLTPQLVEDQVKREAAEKLRAMFSRKQ